jgi:4-amino-4-deoxy-L-arabinose transferase-like glycosyltransferase
MTWDEVFYYQPFKDVASWIQLFFSDPGLALSHEGVVLGWDKIHELPPLLKWLGGVAVLLSPGGVHDLTALRVIPALAFGASLALIYLISKRVVGELSALLSVVIYATLPRIVGHAQIAATETVFTAVTLLVLWVATHDLSKWRWKVLLALVVGLALATKVNGIILLFVMFFWLLTRGVFNGVLCRQAIWKKYKHDLLTAGLIFCIAPVVALAIWPWMWHDMAARLAEYYRFISEHLHQGLWYFGERMNFPPGVSPPAPMSYPFVMSHLVTPILWLAMFWVAVLAGLIRLTKTWRIRPVPFLCALLVLAPIMASSLPNSPKYDGIRLFHPMFAPAAILTGIGFQWFNLLIGRRSFLRLSKRGILVSKLSVLVVIGFLLVERPSVDDYNGLAQSSLREGKPFEFEQTYWGNALTFSVVEDLNKELSQGARVKALALQGGVFEILQEWGVLRSDIIFDGPAPYDYHLIQNRKGFWGKAEWSIHNGRLSLNEWGKGVGGEPLIFLYDGRPPGVVDF